MQNKKWTLRKIIRTAWMAGGLIFVSWLFYSYQSRGVGEEVFRDSGSVTVEENSDYYSFTPTREFRQILFFYPGAMVDPEAYAPLCRKISEHNVKVYLVRMPWRLASNGYTKPKELHLFGDTTKTYILAGHSQGAKMAAQFVYENPALIDKLILIGSSHPRDISLADSNVPVLKIYGSNDGVADERGVLDNKVKLPATAKFIRLEGANHSQFGYYGFQFGDDEASISREQQQAETLKAIVEFLDR